MGLKGALVSSFRMMERFHFGRKSLRDMQQHWAYRVINGSPINING